MDVQLKGFDKNVWKELRKIAIDQECNTTEVIEAICLKWLTESGVQFERAHQLSSVGESE